MMNEEKWIIIDDYEPLKLIGGGSSNIESNPTSNGFTGV